MRINENIEIKKTKNIDQIDVDELEVDENNRLILLEQTEYSVEFINELTQDLKEQVNKDVFKWVTKTSGILNFYNYVGLAKFCGSKLNIQSRKIGSRDFENMLIEVTENIADLPFDYNSPTYLPFDRTEVIEDDVLYHNFIYLRYIMLKTDKNERLEPLIHRIIHNPFRYIYKEEIDKDISFASKINQRAIYQIFENSDCLAKLPEDHQLARTELATKMKSLAVSNSIYYPVEILDEKMQSTLDTNENRFIKYFLISCLDIIDLFREKVLKKGAYLNAEIEEDIKIMETQLNQLLTHNFFYDLGDLTQIPFNSQVLQKRDGYREVFQHFAKMNLAMNYPINSEDYRKIIDNKDIATLYEYWTFFKLAKLLTDVVGKVENAVTAKYDELRKELAYSIKLKYPHGINLYYNRSFSGNKPAGRKGSYSTTLRPDITLEIGNRLYLFDAKFKYDTPQDFFGKGIEKEDDSNKELDHEEKEEEKTKTFTKGDLYKMHTYRDAIHNVKSVWILYPGDEFKFFSEEKGRVESIDEFEGDSGVGAVPMQVKRKLHIDCEMLLSKILEREEIETVAV